MSLKALHIIFVTASTLLALGFGAWCFRQYFAGDRATGDLVFGIVSMLVAVGLIIYGRYFLKKLKDTSYL